MAEHRKKIGLALGGGGARGLAHVGVINALLRAGIPIDYIAGTSMVALLDSMFSRLRAKDILPVGKILMKRDGALFRDSSVADVLESHIKSHSIASCAIPFAAIATDAQNGETVVLSEGSLLDAIRASIALPIIFQPVKHDGRSLMDGGFSNPVPADVVRRMGADYVIAVDVTSQWLNVTDSAVGWNNMYSVVSNALSVIEYQISREILKQADIVLRPPVLQYHWLSFEAADDIIVAGVDETNANLKAICAATGNPLPEATPLEKIIDLIRGR
jgi:NTE family protein